MKTRSTKRGRPPGASQYAGEDREPLERMYVLCKQGKSVSAAATAVAKEMKLRPRPDQAAERLRKKFPQFRKERDKALRSARPEPQSGIIRSIEIAQRAQKVGQLLRTPEGKAITERVRWVGENKDMILQVMERARQIRKSKL